MNKLFSILIAFALSTSYAASPQTIKQSAQVIDEELNKQYVAAKVSPQGMINDDKFVRRAYLSIAGRIPSYAEYEQFGKVADPNKRTELVKYLVNTKGFNSNMFNFWAENLRLRDRLNNINFLSGTLYLDWIKKSLESNKPYDKFVQELLVSNGDYYTNPATGYYERDVGMPLDNLIATSKVFMGVDISCAQCHDDPFQEWSQVDFYEMASLFFQTQASGRRNPAAREKSKQLREEAEKLVKDDAKLRGLNNQVNNFLSAALVSVGTDANRSLKYPADYRYKDHKAGETVTPKVLFGEWPITNKEDMRQDAVAWMTSPKHPTFTKNIVNRYWGMIFGRPIIADVDSIDSAEKLASPLLVALEKIFKDLNYNSKDFIQVLCSTKLFQREAYIYPVKDNFVFIGPVENRLSAEQVWDSILSIVVENPDYFTSTFSEAYKQVMLIEDYDKLTLNDVRGKLDKARDANRDKYYGAQTYKGYNLIRASEVTDLAPPNNILAQLGRSDRELIGTSSREGSVTQVISLMNGQISDIVTKKDSALQGLIKGKSPAEQTEIIFKSILSRKPTIKEKSLFANSTDEDLIWALINSNEFKLGS